jgi:hypothetical protein
VGKSGGVQSRNKTKTTQVAQSDAGSSQVNIPQQILGMPMLQQKPG